MPSGSRLNQEETIKRFKLKHGDKYDYSKVVFTKVDEEVEIVCLKHGSFRQTPYNHYNRGQGCRFCYFESKKKPFDIWLTEAKSHHGDKYDYSLVEFKGWSKSVTIVCKEHGPFNQSPSNHINGNNNGGCGCPLCAKSGYKIDKPANFYIHKVGDVAIKYGITNNPVASRAATQQRFTKLCIETIIVIRGSGQSMKDLECGMKGTFGGSFLTKEQMSDGYTETLPISALPDVLSYLESRSKHDRPD